MIQLDEGQVQAWLDYLFADARGFINIVSTNNWAGRCFTDTASATAHVIELDKQKPQGIYARMGTLAADPGSKRRGGDADGLEFVCLWGDLDLRGPNHKTVKPLPATEADLMAIIETSGLPEPSEWIHSGGGMYPIWSLRFPIALDGQLEAVSELSSSWQRVIELASGKMGFSYGAGIGDISRVLRIPGTVNRKIPDDPRLCEWRMDLGSQRSYEFGELVRAKDNALAALEPPKPVAKPAALPSPSTASVGERPGDAFNAATTWAQLLEADGAQLFRDRGAYQEWVRPGKDRRDGSSATSNYMGSGLLKVFTDAWPGLDQDATYDRFGYFVKTRHNGDFNAATKALSALGYGERKFERPVTMAQPEWVPPFTAADAPTEAQLAAGVTAAPKRRPGTPTYSFTESGFADRLDARYGDDFRFVASRDRNAWLRWEDGIWKTDKRNTVMNLVDRLVQEEYARAAEVAEDEKGKLAYQKSLHGMLRRSAQSGAAGCFSARPQVAIEADQLDTVQSKVVCGNGVFDLDAMEFGPFDRSLLATKKLGVDYQAGAKAPKWDKFLSEVLPDPSVRDYLQRLVGYTLTGRSDLKAIVMFHGTGNCGKGQVINALTEIFGGLSASVREQSLVVNDSPTAATPGLQKLRGARLVTGSETREGARLDEALLKKLAGGGDLIDSRGLWADEETWKPQFTLFLATNFLPKFNADDDAIWRRVKPIHFTQLFGGNGLPEVLDIGRKLVAEEGPGILNWILEGLKRYREMGLADNEAIKQGVVAYQRDADPVARFLDEAISHGDLVAEADAKIEAKQLYSWFTQWCVEEGIKYPLAANRFGRRLTTLGYQRTKNPAGDVRMWAGIKAGESRWLIGGSATRF